MCGIFGYINYGELIDNEQMEKIYLALSKECSIRGGLASGISYVSQGKILIQKAPCDITRAGFSIPRDTITLMAHCRFDILNNYMMNINNHPFLGRTANDVPYAFAHNGILAEIRQLRDRYDLAETDIETDSYGAVQLLNTLDEVNIENLKYLCERVDGSYAFTILDGENNLYLCRGDVPIFLVHFKEYKLYLYISTRDLFEAAISNTELDYAYRTNNVEARQSPVSIIHLQKGDIVRITQEGELSRGCFEYREERAIYHNWYMHQIISTPVLEQQLSYLNN